MKLDARTIAGLALPPGKTDAIHFDSDLPGFGLRLRRGGDALHASWIAQYRVKGRTRRVKVGSADKLTPEEARKAARKILAQAELGQDPSGDRAAERRKSVHTLRSVAEQFIAARSSGWRERTRQEATRYLLNGTYFRPLHSTVLTDLTRADISARIGAILRGSGTVAALRARSAISDLLAWAVAEGLADNNVAIGSSKPKAPPPRDRVLSDDELAAIWKACGDDDFGKIVRLLMLLGSRRTEVGGMTWGELDLERGTWTLPAARAKNHREHTLPLGPLALAVIEGVPQVVGRDHLFGERADDGFTSWARSKAQLDSRLKIKPWTLHDIRRSVATGMADIGVEPHHIEACLNHYSGHRSGVAGVYNRSNYANAVRAALMTWDDHVRALIQGTERVVIPIR